MKIENLIKAAQEYDALDKKCRAAKTITGEDMKAVKSIETNYGVTIEQCEVFVDVLESINLEQELREAMLEVYSCALLKLAEEYDFDNKMKKSVIASCLMDVIE